MHADANVQNISKYSYFICDKTQAIRSTGGNSMNRRPINAQVLCSHMICVPNMSIFTSDDIEICVSGSDASISDEWLRSNRKQITQKRSLPTCPHHDNGTVFRHLIGACFVYLLLLFVVFIQRALHFGVYRMRTRFTCRSTVGFVLS